MLTASVHVTSPATSWPALLVVWFALGAAEAAVLTPTGQAVGLPVAAGTLTVVAAVATTVAVMTWPAREPVTTSTRRSRP